MIIYYIAFILALFWTAKKIDERDWLAVIILGVGDLIWIYTIIKDLLEPVL